MKTALILEGGALRTVFSCGVCDAMLEGGVKQVDYLVGVSAGIAYGVSFASGQPRRNLEVLTRFTKDRRYMGVGNLLDPRNRSYFGLKFTYNTIPNELVPFDYDAFEAFPGQVDAVVTNMNTGRAEYLPVPRRDPDSVLLQASCALPLMFPIYHIDGIPYMDGGVADAIPFEHAFELGCERVMVVLTKTREYVRKPDTLLHLVERKYRAYPNFCRTMAVRAEHYNQCREKLFQMEREGKVLVVAPEDTLGVSRTERDINKLKLLWGQGYQMGMERLEEIRLFLE